MHVQRVVLWMAGAMLAATLLQAGARPLTVSPGDLERFSMAESACPTFSWALVGDAALYELAVSSAGDERSVSSEGATLERTLLGQASSWSPGRDDCLAPGRRYGWSFRARVGDEWTDWSEARFFETPAAQATSVSSSDPGRPGAVVDQGAAGRQDSAHVVADQDTRLLPPADALYGINASVVSGIEPAIGLYANAGSAVGAEVWAAWFGWNVRVNSRLVTHDLEVEDDAYLDGNTHIYAALGPSEFPVCMELNLGGVLKRCTSSRRFKERIQPLELGGLDTVQALQPVQFRWMKGNPDLGFIAEEVAAVDPLLTTFGEQGEIEGVKYRQLTAVLVKALQEQQAELVAFRAQVERELIKLRTRSSCGDRPAATRRP